MRNRLCWTFLALFKSASKGFLPYFLKSCFNISGNCVKFGFEAFSIDDFNDRFINLICLNPFHAAKINGTSALITRRAFHMFMDERARTIGTCHNFTCRPKNCDNRSSKRISNMHGAAVIGEDHVAMIN